MEGGSGLALLLGVGDAARGFDLDGLGEVDSEAVRDIAVTILNAMDAVLLARVD